MARTTNKHVEIGDRRLPVPPLSLNLVRYLTENDKARLKSLSSIVGLPTEEQLDMFLHVIHTSLASLTKDLTLGFIEENVALEEIPGIFTAILTASGFTKREQDQGEATGP